jgi:hypothetical protein
MRRVAALAATSIAMSAATATADTGRLVGTFRMEGRITKAVGVRGEHKGQKLTRSWSIGSPCLGPATCPAITVDRLRGAGHHAPVTIRRRAEDVWLGNGAYTFPLRCEGRRYPKGGLAPYTLRIKIIAVQLVQDVPFATAISANYVSKARINRTRCAGGFGSDAAQYTGFLASPLPAPPQGSFTAQPPQLPSATVAFADTSQPGANGAALVARQWDFGDPASGAANTSADAAPSHTFSAHGTYRVTLTVTDGHGLKATVQQDVSA